VKLNNLILEAKFIKDKVYFEEDSKNFYIINIETKEQNTYNKKYYKVWFEGRWSGNKHLLILDKNHKKLEEYWNVYTEFGNRPGDDVIGLDPEIKSMKSARNINVSNTEMIKTLKTKGFKEYKGSPEFKGKHYTNKKLIISIPNKNNGNISFFVRDYDVKNGTTKKTVKTLDDLIDVAIEKDLKGVLKVLKRLKVN
jgi:hypothetical protein